PAKAWHGVVLLADAKTMEMEVRPIEADPQEDVKIGQGAVRSYEKAPPAHRVNPPDPDVDTVSFGLRIVFHYGASLIRWTTPRLFLAPGLKCSLRQVLRHGNLTVNLPTLLAFSRTPF